jgi:hypothetical protein
MANTLQVDEAMIKKGTQDFVRLHSKVIFTVHRPHTHLLPATSAKIRHSTKSTLRSAFLQRLARSTLLSTMALYRPPTNCNMMDRMDTGAVVPTDSAGDSATDASSRPAATRSSRNPLPYLCQKEILDQSIREASKTGNWNDVKALTLTQPGLYEVLSREANLAANMTTWAPHQLQVLIDATVSRTPATPHAMPFRYQFSEVSISVANQYKHYRNYVPRGRDDGLRRATVEDLLSPGLDDQELIDVADEIGYAYN